MENAILSTRSKSQERKIQIGNSYKQPPIFPSNIKSSTGSNTAEGARRKKKESIEGQFFEKIKNSYSNLPERKRVS